MGLLKAWTLDIFDFISKYVLITGLGILVLYALLCDLWDWVDGTLVFIFSVVVLLCGVIVLSINYSAEQRVKHRDYGYVEIITYQYKDQHGVCYSSMVPDAATSSNLTTIDCKYMQRGAK